MKKHLKHTNGLVAGVILGAAAFSANAALDYRFYGAVFGGDPIPDPELQGLLDDPRFPDDPDIVDRHEATTFFQPIELTSTLTSGRFEFPQNGPDSGAPTGDSGFNDYGGAVSGILYPPVTGTYTFHVRSDDSSALFLNTEGPEFLDPLTATPIAEETGCCNAFVRIGDQASDPIELEVGQGYALEFLWKEGGGGDWFQVGWSINGGPIQVIPSYAVQRDVRYGEDNAEGITYGSDEDPFVTEGEDFCCLGVEFDKDGVAEVQWEVDDGSGWQELEDIPGRIVGAQSPALHFFSTSYDWNEWEFRPVVDGEEWDAVVLEVDPDEDAPEVTGISPRGNPNGVTVSFSEPVSEDTALDAANYDVSGRTIDSVEFTDNSGSTVRLNLGGDAFVLDQEYSVSVSGIQDRGALANELEGTVERSFVFGAVPPVTEPSDAWLFDEGSGDTANPIYGSAAGALEGGAEWSDDSPFPGSSASVAFPGNEGDGVHMGELTYNGATQWSFSTWIRSDAIGQDRGFWEAVDSGGADAWGIRYDSTGATAGGSNVFKLGLTTSGSNGNINNGADQQESAENVQTTEWQHVVMVWDSGNGFSLWIDGELDEPTSPHGLTDGELTDMLYFRLGDGSKAPWQGKVGETAVWDGHALTEEEIGFLARNSLNSAGDIDPARVGPVRFTDGGAPTNQTGDEHGTVTFSAFVEGSPFGRSYQWLRDGEPIPGADEAIYEAGPLSSLWDGAQITVRVMNEFSEITSDPVTLQVDADVEAPEIVNVLSTPFNNQLSVSFSEPMDAATITDVANYSLAANDGGAISVHSATASADATSVVLAIDQLQDATGYTLSYSGLADQAGEPNIAEGSASFFSNGRRTGGLTALFYELSGSALGFLADADPGEYPDGWEPFGSGSNSENIAARRSSVISYFESPNSGDINVAPGNVADNFGQIIFGHVTPPETGLYRFFVATDDSSQLWLSEDADPANAEIIAEEPAWNAIREYDDTDDPKEDNWSDPIELVAGEEYYIELRHSEGGGGDNAAVAWAFTTDGSEPPVPANGSNPIPGEFLISSLPIQGAVSVSASSPIAGALVSPLAVDGVSVTLVDGAVDQVDTATISVTVNGQSVEATVESDGNGAHVVTATLAEELPGESVIDVVVNYQTTSGAAGSTTYQFETTKKPEVGGIPPVGKLGSIAWVSFHSGPDAPSGPASDEGFIEAPDRAYTDLLEASGYEVDHIVTSGSPDANILEAYDLIIIGRGVSSGHYANDSATAWNGIGKPMIIMSGYTLRSSRMGFTTGTDMPDTTGDIKLQVADPSHPIFGGVALDEDGVTIDDFAGVVEYPDGTTVAGTVARGISINNNAMNGGTLLASIADGSDGPVGGMVIAEWSAGSTLTHDGGAGSDTLIADRLVFLSGSREADGVTSETAGLYDLTDTGAQMFVNAVDYMLHPEPFNVAWVSFHSGADQPSGAASDIGFIDAPDRAYTDILVEAGYNVDHIVTSGSPDVEALNGYDLVIIGRGVSSGNYAGDSGTAWNSVDAPMMIMSGYTLRSNRMGFTSGATMVDTTGDINLNVLDPSHAIFSGIETTEDGVTANVFAGVVEYPTGTTAEGTLARGISVNNDPLNGGATLATISGSDGGPENGVIIAEWQPGEALTHDGGAGTDFLTASRLVFLSGSREADGVTSETAGLWDLTDDGAQLYLNAVRYGVSRKSGGGGPVTGPGSAFTSVSLEGGVLTISWDGDATLESTPALGSEWTPVDGATSPYTATPDGDVFYRLVD